MNFRKISLYIFYGLLAYVPVHIFISIWVGSSLGILDFMKAAKDIFLVIGFLLLVANSEKEAIKTILKAPITLLIIAYATLTVVMALLRPTGQEAEVLAVVYNTRFFLFFLYGWLLTFSYSADELLRNSVKTVMATSLVVLLFGVVQYTLLSPTALENIGYSKKNGAYAFFAIDSKPDLERIMSTGRDPNTYGSYLIIIGTFAASILLYSKRKSTKQIMAGILGLTSLNLFWTFSRSAWIGFILAGLSLALFSQYKTKITSFLKKYALLIFAVLLIGFFGLWAARDTYLVKNIVFHADESTTLEDPNELRIRFFKESVTSIKEQPFGHGPGTAGIVSLKNDGKIVLNENYYLQVGYELGILGLVLFMAILVIVFRTLINKQSNLYISAILASFIGLAFTNTLVHVWTNESVAYTWWGLAGIITTTTYSLDRKSKSVRTKPR